MEEQLRALAASAKAEIAAATDRAALDKVRVKYLGKQSELQKVMSQVGKLPPDQRKAAGAVMNQVKTELEAALTDAAGKADEAALAAELTGPKVDVTLPGRGRGAGRRHPASQTLDDIVAIFARLGFEVSHGPEIELDWFNFEALNMPLDHPARDMQDTFYVEGGWLEGGFAKMPMLLRTHTSPVQIRHMLTKKGPIRAVMPGRVYRRDSDITHTPMFHQVEGLYVDKGVTFAELKGTLDAFAKAFFGSNVRARFRPSFFPFTEPSAEVDISCASCNGSGCRICKMTGWLEVGGSGMVHPNVLRMGGHDPEKVTGFAFGMGVERMAMLRHGIDDLRLLFENDHRFLSQF